MNYDKQKEYAFYIFEAHVAMIDQESCEKQKSVRYEKAVIEWEDYRKEPTIEELPIILTVCIKANNGDLFGQYWRKVPPLYALHDERFKQIKPRFEQEIIDFRASKQTLQPEDYRKYWSCIKNATLNTQIEILCETDIMDKVQNNKEQVLQYTLSKR